MEIFSNSHFWALIAFIITISLSFKKVYTLANTFLSSKIVNIKKEIQDSEDTIAEALSLLNERKKALHEIINNGEEQITQAKLNVESTYEKTLYDISRNNSIVKENFENYINKQSSNVLLEIKKEALDLTINSVALSVKNSVDEKQHFELIEKSILSIKNKITT